MINTLTRHFGTLHGIKIRPRLITSNSDNLARQRLVRIPSMPRQTSLIYCSNILKGTTMLLRGYTMKRRDGHMVSELESRYSGLGSSLGGGDIVLCS